ncbi:hypothetical protein [Variovorax ginsengisoli]|uniref:Glycosyl hydrolase family 32 N-terminal domain-containing protein n=1 Tax=Variovorax ginsengisoli TaxID=363844 RepID=A0ABT8S1Z7_9BURK|nr:hypothetical protein [Variovorax ginsengisoli]MDN8612827.1 hypothetical protein [Variovorax ginsengisoli]MDO1531997.1 hypothetical protein [Variovorax ginsengisoli]
MGHWIKQGLLYALPPGGLHPKLLTHAANPLPAHIADDVYRIFFSARDSSNRSSVGAVDVDIGTRQIVREHSQPFFEHGPTGSFYADGVSIGNCYEVGGTRYMLFMGWQAPTDGHWRGDIGRLVVRSDLTLALNSPTPFLGADPIDPISLSYPWVINASTDRFRMWYPSTKTWDAGNGEMLAVLNVADSADGHQWVRKGLGVPYELGRAQAFSRPNVLGDPIAGYEMWFSYRGGGGRSYRIGYAVSPDATDWELRLDDVGIDVSREGWDSEMIEYPFVFDHRGRRFMLYNGNGYGKSGFGIAELVASEATTGRGAR